MRHATLLTILFLSLIFPFKSNTYANEQADKVVGSWQINATVNAEVVYKNWTGTITVNKQGKTLTAVLDWASENGEWHVVQDMSVSKNGKEVTLQGTSVNIITKPEHMTEYLPDTFKFNLDDKTNNTIPVMAGDTKGTSMTFSINKL